MDNSVISVLLCLVSVGIAVDQTVSMYRRELVKFDGSLWEIPLWVRFILTFTNQYQRTHVKAGPIVVERLEYRIIVRCWRWQSIVERPQFDHFRRAVDWMEAEARWMKLQA